MTTVALLGLDGAGKTSVAQHLLKRFPVPMKYLYMGYHIPSSNVALPTSRFIYHLKLKRFQRRHNGSHADSPSAIPVHEIEFRADKRGHLSAFGRLLNRLSEQCFRQVVCWHYVRQGHIVLFDRHFLFQAALPTGDKQQRLAERLNAWFLESIYPRPDMVIFLDASPEVLYSRKQEGTLEFLAKRREKYLEQGQRVANFVVIDASQPLENVLDEVTNHIHNLLTSTTQPNPVLEQV